MGRSRTIILEPWEHFDELDSSPICKSSETNQMPIGGSLKVCFLSHLTGLAGDLWLVRRAGCMDLRLSAMVSLVADRSRLEKLAIEFSRLIPSLSRIRVSISESAGLLTMDWKDQFLEIHPSIDARWTLFQMSNGWWKITEAQLKDVLSSSYQI